GSEEPEHFAALDLEVDATNRLMLSVGLAQSVDGDGGVGHSLPYLPLKLGVRFSENAFGPSWASSVMKMGWPISSSRLRPSTSDMPSVSCTDCLMALIERGPLAAMTSATARASLTAVPSGTTLVIRPMRSASSAGTGRPVS